MALKSPEKFASLGDCVVVPSSSATGGLNAFATLINGATHPTQTEWALWEILSSIPDIKREFLIAYPTRPSHVLQLEKVHSPPIEFDRVSLQEFATLQNENFDFRKIRGFNEAYVSPQRTSEFIVLYRKRTMKAIGTRSTAGDTYLEIPHIKGETPIQLNQMLAFVMALYAVGMLTRYSPAEWHPFVHADATGERHVIENLLAVADRYLPNLVLNIIESKEIQFQFVPKETIRPHLTRAEVEAIVDENVKSRLRRRGGHP